MKDIQDTLEEQIEELQEQKDVPDLDDEEVPLSIKELVDDILRKELEHLHTKAIDNSMSVDDARKLDLIVKTVGVIESMPDKDPVEFNGLSNEEIIEQLSK